MPHGGKLHVEKGLYSAIYEAPKNSAPRIANSTLFSETATDIQAKEAAKTEINPSIGVDGHLLAIQNILRAIDKQVGKTG